MNDPSPTVHLVYPADPRRVAAPWTIGNHLRGAIDAAGFRVCHYDWEHVGCVAPVDGDILIGHPHPSGERAFHELLRLGKGKWELVIGISPWNGSEEYTANIRAALPKCESYFAICGPYWAKRLPAEWTQAGRVRALDMAVDAAEFPPLPEAAFCRLPGKRRFLYIGCTLPCKGPDRLEAWAQSMHAVDPTVEFWHIGPGIIPRWRNIGYAPDLRDPDVRCGLASCDFLLCAGTNDANPTTVLEAMCLGLIPLAVPTCGWEPPDVRIVETADDLRRWIWRLEAELATLRAYLRRRVLRYSWDAFTRPVLEAAGLVEATPSKARPSKARPSLQSADARATMSVSGKGKLGVD